MFMFIMFMVLKRNDVQSRKLQITHTHTHITARCLLNELF